MKWTDITKREPPAGNHVLIVVRMRHGKQDRWDRWHTTIALPERKRGKLTWFFSHTLGPRWESSITHWMPLPELPNNGITETDASKREGGGR